MKCSQCGSDAATGAGTCPGCGAVIPTATLVLFISLFLP